MFRLILTILLVLIALFVPMSTNPQLDKESINLPTITGITHKVINDSNRSQSINNNKLKLF